MMKKIVLTILFSLFTVMILLAQIPDLKVEKITPLTSLDQGEFFFPKLTPDGGKIVFTGPKFHGLFVMDLENKKIEALNEDDGAGYEFQISGDGKYVIYRQFEFKNKRKFYTLKKQNLRDKQVTIIEKEVRELSPPRMVKNSLLYLKDEQPVKVNLQPALNKTVNAGGKAVFIKSGKIVLIDNGEIKELAPLGDGIYIWPELSPDGQKIVFTFAGDATYICDLNGEILTKIGYANAPTWSPDGKWIAYMVDHDDGHFYTDSEIFISAADGSKKIQITDTADIIEMYPNWGADISKLVFSSNSGQIFLAKLKQD